VWPVICPNRNVFRPPFSITLIGRFVILFCNAAPEIAERSGLPVPAFIFLRKWLFAKHFLLA
jgi:hypothetical protein